MWRLLIKACILLAVTTHVNTQYADFFSSLNAFLQPFATTKRPDARHKHTHKHKNDDIINFQAEDQIKETITHSTKRKSSQTTPRPKPKSINSNKINNSRNGGIIRSISDSREPYNNLEYNNYKETTDNDFTTHRPNNRSYGPATTGNSRREYGRTRPDSNYGISSYTNGRGNYGTTSSNRRIDNWNGGTTKNPLLNRPGVKPAVVDENRPPITNKPVTVKPVYDIPFDSGAYRPDNTYNRPQDSIRPVNTRPPFELERPRPGTTVRPNRPVDTRPGNTNRPGNTVKPEVEPDIEIGPDEDDMSEAQRRRFYDICEQKCSEYKKSNVRKVVALPLAGDQRAEFNVSSCVRAKVPLIIGGQVVDITQFPHMALVGWKKLQSGGYSWKCGGSLISARHVLTAGHCTYYDKDDQIVSGAPTAVQLGSSRIDGKDGIVVSISAVIRHPKFKLRRSYYDVAVIRMETTVEFSDKISPACLGVPPPVGEPIIATGWGKTEFGGDHSVELRSVSLPIWDMDECREIWGTSRKLPQGPMASNQICAGERKGAKDTCQGDSGGPAQIQDGCAWRVVAVTSVGRSCGAPDTPALYATIPRAFIASVAYGNDGGTGGNGGGNTGNNGGGTGWNSGGNAGNSGGGTGFNIGGNTGNNGGGTGWNSGVNTGNNGGGNAGNNWGNTGNNAGGTGWNSGGNTGFNGGGTGWNSGGNTGSNSWGNTGSTGGGNTNSGSNNNRGTDNVWGNNNGGNVGNSWGTGSSGSGSNNRDTNSNKNGQENSGFNHNKGTDSNIWGIAEDIGSTNNNRGTQSNINNKETYNNRGTTSKNYAIGSNIRDTINNANNNKPSDSWASASNNREIGNNNRQTQNNNGRTQSYNERTQSTNGRTQSYNERTQSTNGRTQSYNERTQSNNGRTQSYNERTQSTNGRTQSYNERTQSNNGRTQSNNGRTQNNNRHTQNSDRVPDVNYEQQKTTTIAYRTQQNYNNYDRTTEAPNFSPQNYNNGNIYNGFPAAVPWWAKLS